MIQNTKSSPTKHQGPHPSPNAPTWVGGEARAGVTAGNGEGSSPPVPVTAAGEGAADDQATAGDGTGTREGYTMSPRCRDGGAWGEQLSAAVDAHASTDSFWIERLWMHTSLLTRCCIERL
jgi:hypothetical protein